MGLVYLHLIMDKHNPKQMKRICKISGIKRVKLSKFSYFCVVDIQKKHPNVQTNEKENNHNLMLKCLSGSIS